MSLSLNLATANRLAVLAETTARLTRSGRRLKTDKQKAKHADINAGLDLAWRRIYDRFATLGRVAQA